MGAFGPTGPTGPSGVQSALTRFVVPVGNQLTAISAFGNASASFQYVPVFTPVTGTRLDALVYWAGASAATSNTCAFAISAYAAIYSNNGSTLSSLSSGSTQTTYSYASNTAGMTQLTAAAMRPISCPLNFSLTAGEYLVGFNFVTATSSLGAATTNYGQTISMIGGELLQTTANYAEFGSNTASTANLFGGMGVYSVATTGLPAGPLFSQIVQTGASLSQANLALVFRNG